MQGPIRITHPYFADVLLVFHECLTVYEDIIQVYGKESVEKEMKDFFDEFLEVCRSIGDFEKHN